MFLYSPCKNELLCSPSNGNYLGIMELSQLDTFLAEHICQHGNKGRGNTSYISSTIFEELIEWMGQKVLSIIIVAEIKSAKYFSISAYRPHARYMHVDQLTLIPRYVAQSGPVE